MGFDPLHIVRSSWPDISTKIIEKAPFVNFVLFTRDRILTNETWLNCFIPLSYSLIYIGCIKSYSAKFVRNHSLVRYFLHCDWLLPSTDLKGHSRLRWLCKPINVHNVHTHHLTCVTHESKSPTRRPITFVYFVGHASAQALRPITFSQRFRTARHLFKLMSKRRVSSDRPGMKNIPGEVSIFCLWTNWIHLLTCGKIEFRELYYLHFRSLSTRVVWPKIVFGLWRLKRRELENNQTIFETCVLNPLRGQKIKENLFWRKVKRTAFSESGTYVSYTISLC